MASLILTPFKFYFCAKTCLILNYLEFAVAPKCFFDTLIKAFFKYKIELEKNCSSKDSKLQSHTTSRLYNIKVKALCIWVKKSSV